MQITPPDNLGQFFVIQDDGTRRPMNPGHYEIIGGASQWFDTDVSGEASVVQNAAAQAWTAQVKTAWRAFCDANVGQLSTPPSAVRLATFQSDTNRQAILAAIGNATPAQVASYVNNNVTDLASAKAMLVKITLLLATLAS